MTQLYHVDWGNINVNLKQVFYMLAKADPPCINNHITNSFMQLDLNPLLVTMYIGN